MFNSIKAMVWTCFYYKTPFVIVWLLCVVSTFIFWTVYDKHKTDILCGLPGYITAKQTAYFTGTWFAALPGLILCYISIFTWNPVTTIFYIIYIVVSNVLFVRLTFPTANALLAVFGIYKHILMWKEVAKCRSSIKEKNTKKTMASRKTMKKPNTMTKTRS